MLVNWAFIYNLFYSDSGSSATVPGAPTGVAVSTVSTSETQVTWVAPASDGGSPITGYKIERESPVGGGFATIVANTGSTSTTYNNNSGLSAGTQYNYRISAINAIGTGSASTASYGYTLDTDVSTFITAKSIVNTQEINALNEGIIQLKGLNSLSKNYYAQASYINLISPTSLNAAKGAIKFPTTQNATDIGTAATHSSDGVLFNGTTQGWNLQNAFNTIPQANLLILFSRSNTITVNGVSIGGNDVSVTNSAQFYPRPVSTSGYLTGTSHGTLATPGVYVGSNDGTNMTIHKDGVLITPSAPVARLTGTPTNKNAFFGCRNNNATANAFVDERVTSIIYINMGATPYTTLEISVLSQIIQTYNTNVA